MRYITITILLLSYHGVSHAQQLVKKYSWKTSAILDAKIEWVDIDNDSLLDVLVLAKDTNQKLQIQAYTNKLDSFPRKSIAELDFSLNSYSLIDINNDNKIDLILNGSKTNHQTVQLTNQSKFQFTPSNIPIPSLKITQQAWADFDLDGKMDWIVGGTNFLKIFQSTTNGFVLKLDSTGLNVASIVTGDFTKDGKTDLFVSGSKAGMPFMSLLKNKNKFLFQTIPILRGLHGAMEKGDFNHDGNFDIVGSGLNVQSRNLINYYAFKDDKFTVVDSLKDYQQGQLSIADVNSDGSAELSYFGKFSNGKKINIVRDTLKVISDLDTTQLVQQKWGDFDRDGDLDLLRVRDSSNYQIFEVLENKSPIKNKSPKNSGYTFWASVFNKTILYWSPSTDDLTPTKALTYDLNLTRNGESLVTGLFDETHETRLTPSNGNQMTNTFIILPGVGCPSYSIQSVDNAFKGSKLFKVPCAGNCSNYVTSEQVQACKGTNTIIGSDEEAHWFSFSNGFKGRSKKLSFIANQPDTIASVTYSGSGCPKVRAYIININEPQKKEMVSKYACVNQPVKLGISTGWQTVQWTFGNETSTKDTITLITKKELTVSVEASANNNVCKYKKDFFIKISDFELKLDNDQYIINQGESAQLVASGGAKYEWLPNVALSNNKVANPVASPIQTIQYEVTALDSINCSKKASVKVEVINTGFLPNLFTPNGDGKNDDYKILGLYGAADFEFSIYNREGSIVYETTNWQTASSVGWNGQKAGVNQPSGLYYWKINGKQPNGQALLLNGKNSGSVLLIR